MTDGACFGFLSPALPELPVPHTAVGGVAYIAALYQACVFSAMSCEGLHMNSPNYPPPGGPQGRTGRPQGQPYGQRPPQTPPGGQPYGGPPPQGPPYGGPPPQGRRTAVARRCRGPGRRAWPRWPASRVGSARPVGPVAHRRPPTRRRRLRRRPASRSEHLHEHQDRPRCRGGRGRCRVRHHELGHVAASAKVGDCIKVNRASATDAEVEKVDCNSDGGRVQGRASP